MITLQNLEIGYASKKTIISVYKNINAQFNAGELIGLVGNNGVGKSTLLNTISGNLQPLSGDLLINQKSIKTFTTQQIAQTISIVTTEKITGFNLTVWDVVSMGRIPYINLFAKLSREDEAIVSESLDTLQIPHLKNKLLDELSDGQRQKVMIAKSLAQQTSIIILDEPTAFLDYQSKHLLFKTLQELCKAKNKLIIVSTHDLDLLNQYSTKNLELISSNA